MTGAEARELAYLAMVRDPGCNPEEIADACKVILLAIRHPKFGKYDDELYLIHPAGEHFFRANTDPSRVGWNTGVGKFYAQLVAGADPRDEAAIAEEDRRCVWPVRTGEHRNRPNNFRQPTSHEARALQLERFFKPTDSRTRGHYTVRRLKAAGIGAFETGYFAINGHSGRDESTSSWGCWTLDPDDWAVFQPLAYELLGTHGQVWPGGWVPLVVVNAS